MRTLAGSTVFHQAYAKGTMQQRAHALTVSGARLAGHRDVHPRKLEKHALAVRELPGLQLGFNDLTERVEDRTAQRLFDDDRRAVITGDDPKLRPMRQKLFATTDEIEAFLNRGGEE